MSSPRAHLIVGGFPPGSPAGHDMEYARLRLLELLGTSSPDSQVVPASTVANDFTDIERWLPGSELLITYVAGPHPDERQNGLIGEWLEEGGRWLALHDTSGGRAERVGRTGRRRKMVKGAYHVTLGSFFLTHPPLRRFTVEVANREHVLTRDLPASFEVMDELYLIELQDLSASTLLLTTELAEDPSPPGFGFVYDHDTSLLPDGSTRALGYTRDVGRGGVTYIALGHCHSPASNVQPFVDPSIEADGTTPLLFRGPWESAPFERLLRNALEWGLADR